MTHRGHRQMMTRRIGRSSDVRTSSLQGTSTDPALASFGARTAGSCHLPHPAPWHAVSPGRMVRESGVMTTKGAEISDPGAGLRDLGSGAGEPTPCELAVMRMIAAGYKDRVVARRLGMSIATVRRRAFDFRVRVGAGSRMESVALGVHLGYIRPIRQAGIPEAGGVFERFASP